MNIKKADIYFNGENSEMIMTITFKTGNVFEQIKEYVEKNGKGMIINSIYFREEETK